MLPSVLIFLRDFKPSQEILLDSFDINHLKSLRLYNRDKKLEIRDGLGNYYFFSSPAHSKKAYLLENERGSFATPPRREVGGALPKGSRLDWLLQKGTELGMTDFHFCNMERSVRMDFSMDRAERILKEASAQSNRTHLPNIHIYKDWKDLVEEKGVRNFICLDPQSPEVLQTWEIRGKILLVGPEGGLGGDWEEMKKMGMVGRKLGKEILRMETAYLYGSVLLVQAELEAGN